MLKRHLRNSFKRIPTSHKQPIYWPCVVKRMQTIRRMTSMTNSESLEGGIEQSDWQERLDRFAQRLQLSRHDPISLLELRDDLERTVGLLPGGNPGFRLRALRLLAEASMQTGEYSAAFDVLVSALSIDDFADQDMRDSARMALVDA